MALATNSTPGEIHLNGDIHTSNDAQLPELTPTGVKTGTYELPHVVADSKGRVLTIKDGTLDDIPCATDTSCGVIAIGDNIDVTVGSPAGIVELGIATSATGSPSTVGRVKPNTEFNITVGGVLSLNKPLATAGSPLTLGIVKVGTNLVVDADGVLRHGPGSATTTSLGIVKIGDNIDVTVGSPAGIISIPDATNTTYGKINSNDTNNITIVSGDIDIGNDIVKKDITNPYTISQNSQLISMTNVSGNVDLDIVTADVFHITLNGSTTINSITNMLPNQQVDLIIKTRNAPTSYSLTLNPSFFKISGNTVIGGTTLITCTQIISGGTEYAHTIVQPYML